MEVSVISTDWKHSQRLLSCGFVWTNLSYILGTMRSLRVKCFVIALFWISICVNIILLICKLNVSSCYFWLFLLLFYVQPHTLTPNQLEELPSPIAVVVLRVNISVLDSNEESKLTSVIVRACVIGECIMIARD